MVRVFEASLGTAVLAILQLMGNQAVAQHCDVVQVAEQYIARTFPSFDSAGKKLVVTESGYLREVTYRLPPWMLGGAPVITIDKRTCAVVGARRGQ